MKKNYFMVKAAFLSAAAVLPVLLGSCSKKNVQSDAPDSETALQSYAGSSVTENGIKIDVDLTALNATMVYSEVFNMLVEPAPYNGKKYVSGERSVHLFLTERQNVLIWLWCLMNTPVVSRELNLNYPECVVIPKIIRRLIRRLKLSVRLFFRRRRKATTIFTLPVMKLQNYKAFCRNSRRRGRDYKSA